MIKNFLLTKNKGNGYGVSSEDLALELNQQNIEIVKKVPNRDWNTFKSYINEVKNEMGGCGATGWCKGRKKRRSRRKTRRGGKRRLYRVKAVKAWLKRTKRRRKKRKTKKKKKRKRRRTRR